MTSWDEMVAEAGKEGVDVVLGTADGSRSATVTLNRPEKRNSQTPAFWRALAAVGRALPGTVRVAVLRAEGKSFSAGLDRAMVTPEGIEGEKTFADFAAATDEEADAAIAEYQEAFTWWRRTDLVTVAAVQGHAIGAGFQLALACDIRILADDARFCMKEPAFGLIPDLGGTKALVELVGYSRALEIVATTRFVGAEEALRIGLANHVVPADALQATAAQLAADLSAAPRGAVTEAKALLRGAATRSYDEQRAAERAAQIRRLRDLAGGS
jgi:enoyl-CoA hydratase/carnithine racemase